MKQVELWCENRLRNLYGYEIQVRFFKKKNKNKFKNLNFQAYRSDTSEPYEIVYNHKKQFLRYKFTDGTIMACLTSTMNFTLKRLTQKAFNKTYFDPNNKIPGYLAVIENNQVDMSSTSTLISMMDTKNIAFMNVFDFLEISYMVPKKIVNLNYLVTQFEIFDFITITISLLSFLALTLLWYSIERIRSKTGRKHQTLSDIFLIVIQSQNKVGIKDFSLLNNRGILITIVIFSFVISSTYESIISSRLVNEPKAREIDTLEELDQSGLNILTTIPDVFKPNAEDIDQNSLLYRLYKKQKYLPYSDDLLSNKTNTGLLTRSKIAVYIIAINFDKTSGKDLYHIVKEKPLHLHRSFIIPKTSPYVHRMNEILMRSIESGFVCFATNEGTFEVFKKYIFRTKAGFGEPSRNVVIKIEHFKPLAVLFGICLGFSLIIFILEICYFNIKK